MDLQRAVWRKSSYSNGTGGACVEVALLDGDEHAVRDSKNPSGSILKVPRAAWVPFLLAVHRGEFD
jgi:hypothetical protein